MSQEQIAVQVTAPRPRTGASFAEVFTHALRGVPCYVHGLHEDAHPLPVARWAHAADDSDEALLARCAGPTLDIGCGPGRMTRALADRGHPVLGVDVVAEAVHQARRRGVAALLRNVFDPLPGEGRWGTALLADGNIGIGGDPHRLLRRAGALIGPEGRVVTDLADPGTGIRTRSVRLQTSAARSQPFRWAVVGADAIGVLAAGAGLLVLETGHERGRHFAVLGKAVRR